MARKTVILDIDGTLVDTNFHHAVAWLAVLTGGFSEQELRNAGAGLVVESVEELSRNLPETSLA
jgi:phosphoglycolate phosphatase-like HAD superfamily hydrolase